MSGKRQPIELVKQKGKKHLTKAEIALREAQELHPDADKVAPPGWLDKAQKKRFKELAAQLVALKIMTNLDCEALARLIKAESDYRRYRTSYVQLGRQNGKSFLNGILAAYYGNFTAYQYPKIFCTATKQDQAEIVFDEITKFIRSDGDLQELFKIHDHNHTIDCLLTNGIIKAISGDTKSLDGHRPYLGIVDEYHAHPTNQMYKLLEGGIKKMKSALISVITTAGFNLNAPCYKLYEHCKAILKGATRVETQFVFIAEMDEEDDLWLPENWIKANPALAYDQEALENMIPISVTARDMGGEDLRDFLVKQLNTPARP